MRKSHAPRARPVGASWMDLGALAVLSYSSDVVNQVWNSALLQVRSWATIRRDHDARPTRPDVPGGRLAGDSKRHRVIGVTALAIGWPAELRCGGTLRDLGPKVSPAATSSMRSQFPPSISSDSGQLSRSIDVASGFSTTSTSCPGHLASEQERAVVSTMRAGSSAPCRRVSRVGRTRFGDGPVSCLLNPPWPGCPPDYERRVLGLVVIRKGVPRAGARIRERRGLQGWSLVPAVAWWCWPVVPSGICDE